MTDELQQTASQPGIPPEPQVSAPLPPQPQKSNKTIWIILGVVVGVLCLCSVAFVGVFGTIMVKVNQEKGPIESVLNDFMRHMINKDAENAYALFSPRAQRQIPISKLQESFNGKNYLIYEGYQSLSLSNINLSTVADPNPDTPQGIVAKVTGIIKFAGGLQGSFNATLEKVDGKWMMDGFHITVPPEKLQ